MSIHQPVSYPVLLEKYAQVLWEGDYGQMYGPNATPQGGAPGLWGRIKGALPKREDILKGVSYAQEAGDTAKLLWQLANYTPQYSVESQGEDRAPTPGGYYY